MKKGMVSAFSILAGGLAGAGIVGMISGEQVGKMHKASDKHLALYLMMNQWVRVKQDGKNLVSYFDKHGYRRIAIYGMSYAGKTLIRELHNSDIEIVCGIDQREGMDAEIEMVAMDEIQQDIDVIVVTAITFFDEIKENLMQKVSCPVISLEDILYEI